MLSSHQTKIRVRYRDVDRMGVVYHANYLDYFEWARSDWIRAIWKSYRDLEDSGIFMVVTEASLKFIRPAQFDEELVVTANLTDWGSSRIVFNYIITRQASEVPICTGSTTLCFVNTAGRPMRMPEHLKALIVSE